MGFGRDRPIIRNAAPDKDQTPLIAPAKEKSPTEQKKEDDIIAAVNAAKDAEKRIDAVNNKGEGNLGEVATSTEGLSPADILNKDYSDIEGGSGGVLRAQKELERRSELDNLAALDQKLTDTITGGGSDEDRLKVSKEILNKMDKDQAVKAQVEAEALAQRSIVREQQAAKRAGIDLDIQGKDLLRQQGILSKTLTQEALNFKEGQATLDRKQTSLEREAALTKRQGAIAARAGQQAAAQAANATAQSGFGSSSAALGAQASAQSSAATQAGDILTGLVDNRANQEAITGQRDLLSGQFDLSKTIISDQQQDVVDTESRRQLALQELSGVQSDLSAESFRLKADLSENLDFLQTTFDLGGDISRVSQRLSDSRDQDQRRADDRTNTLSLISQGATVGSAFGPTGLLIGGGVGALLSLF